MKKLTKCLILLLCGIVLGSISTQVYAGTGHTDPEYLPVVSTGGTIVIDGVLDENDWQRRFDYLVFNAGYLTGDVEYSPTGNVLVVGNYSDTTTTLVKFMHDGLDLYISLNSDDKYVGKFGNSWEGDGLFMKIKDANGTAVEYKLFYNLGGVDPEIAFEAPGLYPNSGEGAAWEHAATIVNDTTAADSGYTAEMVIHLDQLGYTNPYAEIPVMINIYDPDNYVETDDPWTTPNASFLKMWWGSEWGDVFRTLRLSDPPSKVAYKTTETITLDGEVNESFWDNAESVIVGKGSSAYSGGYYMQWSDTLNEYTDQSMAKIKFMHNGTDLYIGVESNDSSVCKWSPGWEADGLFLWMTNKGIIPSGGERIEIKAMYFSGTEGDGIVFETNANVPTGAVEAASFEPSGTTTHTATNGADEGYSIELIVHTEYFGYAVGDTVNLSAVIWDLDYASADIYEEHTSDYAPNWWGTQWADPGFEKHFLYRGVVLSDEGSTNNPPVANAGQDQTVEELTEVTLNGSASSDPEGEDLTYEWTAPAEVTLSDANVANPTFEAPEVDENTILEFSLVVNDGALSSDPDIVNITVINVEEDRPKDAHTDPGFIKVVTSEQELTIDGVLDETDWQRRFDYLVYNANYITGDVEYAVTGDELVKGDYIDTTTTLVKFLHHGMDLYISLTSDDQSVCRFGDSWEGDGLFMKIKDAGGVDREFKLYFNLGGTDPDIHYEESLAGSGAGAAWKHSSTIVNDTTQVDSGYTAELVIHLDELGYTDPFAEVPVMINIFDPDNYHDGMTPWEAPGRFHKMWWGSAWGPEFRILKLSDPLTKTAYSTDDNITLDGELNETFWENAEYVEVGVDDALSTGGYYMQWSDSLNKYTDRSTAKIKFMHKGTDLYIGMESNDSSVCKWSPGWEADGLFLWMTNKGQIPSAGERMEIKAMYFSGTEGDGIVFETNANVPTGAVEAASFEPSGTTTHTESNGADHGYSIEVVVHSEFFGYGVGDTVKLSTCVWDLDYSDVNSYNEHISDYAPNWWGTQWVDPNFEKYSLYRGVVLSPEETSIDSRNNVIVENYILHQNYPNPFNPTTRIDFEIPNNELVKLEIYNMLGEKVATLVNTNLKSGYHSVEWDGKYNNKPVPTGVYFSKFTCGDVSKTSKMILLK